MFALLTIFSLFHLVVGTASLALAVRFWTPEERDLWRSKSALLVAELLCWVYPIAAFACAKVAWTAYNAGASHAFPIIVMPIGWLVVMGLVFAIVDFAEDGVLGNARASE